VNALTLDAAQLEAPTTVARQRLLFAHRRCVSTATRIFNVDGFAPGRCDAVVEGAQAGARY
jgi:hypothetical protein